jgi:hypothetical protein
MCEGLHTDTLRIHINNYFYAFYFGYNEMSHSKSLFILIGATILSLILIAGIIDDSITTAALAQQEEKEDEEKEEEDSKDEEEDSSKEEEEKEESEESSSNDDSDSSNEETSSDEQKEEETPTTETPIPNTTAVPEIIPPTQEPIVNLTGDQILNPIPVVDDAIETTTIAEPIIKEEFNATCKCMTTSLGTKPTTPQQPSNQIPVTSANIVDSKSLGQVLDANYTGFYTVSNLLDNKIDDVSFWSQAGKSSFYIKLDNILDQYQVCSAELSVHKPTNAPFLLDIGVTKDYTGVIDQTTEKIQFDKCVKNMDEILMTIENPPNTYISISEIKLFGSKLGTTATPLSPPQTATIPQPTLEPKTEEANKINIQDSIAEISIKNSTVTFKFDPMTATFVQQGGEGVN